MREGTQWEAVGTPERPWYEPPAEPEQVLPHVDSGLPGLESPVHPDVSRLCTYLAWTPERFAANEARYFSALSALLVANGVLAEGQTVSRDSFRDEVRAFQGQHGGLGDDGLPGEDTLWALHERTLTGGPLGSVRVDADPMKEIGGVSQFDVRADVKGPYEAFRAELAAMGAKVVTGGAIRSLDAPVSSGRSATSFHYSGLAIDLALSSGMEFGGRHFWKYLIASDGDRWRVWAHAPAAPEREIDAVIWEGKTTRIQRFKGAYVDLTALAARHGFAAIRPRSCFPAEYVCAEWWHLQFDGGLVPGITPFGVELRKLHTMARLEPSAPWKFRKNLYHRLTQKKGWF